MSKLHDNLNNYRFEFLLAGLLMVLFNKAFFLDEHFYTTYMWPVNMVILGITSFGIFKERELWVRWIKNILFLCSVLIPIFFQYLFMNTMVVQLSFLVYTAWYTLIFVEVMRQIFQRSETTVSVVFGSISGFLLLIVITQFVFLQLEYNFPGSFNGLQTGNIPQVYNQLSYFSMVTLATVGYGDITPKSDAARLATMFFTIAGQFYMVALVGIIISRFTSNSTDKSSTE